MHLDDNCTIKEGPFGSSFIECVKILEYEGKIDMKRQFNYFWWDGGFESVHNKPRPEINPMETAHVLTPLYRFDISRLLASPVGLENSRDKVEEYRYGLVLPPPAIEMTTDIQVILDGKEYLLHRSCPSGRSLMVYDSGTVCHQLRLKGVSLYDKNGEILAGTELELGFYLWSDLISFSIHLVDADTRLPIKGKTAKVRVDFQLEGCEVLPCKDGAYLKEKNGAFYMTAVPETQLSLKQGCVSAYSDSSILCLHILPLESTQDMEAYHAAVKGNMEISAVDLVKGRTLVSGYDPISGGMVVKLPDTAGDIEEKIRITANTESDLDIPLRLLVLREGRGRIMEDGTILPMEEIGGFTPIGVFPVAFRPNGTPSGSLWQVSIDGHEFESYPRPYTHRWLHLYTCKTVSRQKPADEILWVGSSNLTGGIAAAFCQLSLLGWDDNPQYGNPLDKTAVQLWIQGLINHQEILCICPESHMTDCSITDIRPIDHRNSWGPNNGGGDFLRYRLPGSDYMNKMCAARCSFPNYGPFVGTVEYYLTSEDDAITGHVKANIVAADDIARVFFEVDYAVLKDLEVEELVLAWLGCPGYDRSRYARYAWGMGDTVEKDCLVEIQKGPGEELIEKPLTGGEWFAAFRGGIIDEQFREPNANKGMVYRGGSVGLKAHPEAVIKAKRLRMDAFDGLTTQFWLGIYPEEHRIQLKKGDRIKICWEYVPVLKYVTDYGLGSSCSEVYRQILLNHPDSYEMIRYEAKHGECKWKVIVGEAVEDSIFPALRLNNGKGEFELEGGSGWTPLRVYLGDVPEKLKLIGVTEKENIVLRNKMEYQLENCDGEWIATFLIRGGAESLQYPRIKRSFIVSAF